MIGQTISHYRITGQLGSGGMGVVYEAQDLTLGRRVALKFLPSELAREAAALDRFLLEARAASALNHPNICTIYAVESAEGQSFIAMELLEGQSLDAKLSGGPLPLDRLLDVSIQLADALEAAHAKGIVHRDIKPANIFLHERGRVKVLDFGLAKLTHSGQLATGTIGATQDGPGPAHLTSPGSTVGTIAYMSPEQARGEELDARTDLFSLGGVIYQMATGRLPFSGNTSAVIFHAILERDPVSIPQLNYELPLKLDEIIRKALEKDRELRYQSAADLRGDLRRLKRDSESGRNVPQTLSSASTPGPKGSGLLSARSATSLAPQVSSSSVAVTAARRHKLGTGLAALIGLVVLLAAGYGIYSLFFRSRALPFQNISVTKVTDTGNAVLAAIAPDGKYILSLVRENGLASLWLRNVPTNSNAQVAPPADVYYLGLRFSPDSNYLYFERSEPGNYGLKHLYRAPLLGATPDRLATDLDSNITFSPDGRKFAFMRFNNPDPGKYRLVVRSFGSEDESVLAEGPNSEGISQPAWSPDGKTIVCTAGQPGDALSGLVAFDTRSGQRHLLLSAKDAIFALPTWMPDGSGLLVLDRDHSSNFTRQQIAFVSYPEGKLTPITRDSNDYSDLSVAASGQVLATVLSEDRWNLFVMSSTSGGADARQIAPARAFTNFTWTRDGQLIDDKDNVLRSVSPDSGAERTFSTEPDSANGDAWACSDGRYIVFLLGLHGGKSNQNIWRADSSGGNLKQLTNGRLDNYPVCSPDARWVYYIDDSERKLTRVPIDGGASQKVTDVPMEGFFDISPDGSTVAFATVSHAGEHKEKLALVATESGEVRKLLDFERPRIGLLRFTRDGKAVVYAVRENGTDNLWQQPLDGSKGRALTAFKSERIWDFHWSWDGNRLALIRGHTDSDVVLINNQQP